jgi:hypothetical protein
LMLYARVLRQFFAFDAIRKGFKEILGIWCYTSVFNTWIFQNFGSGFLLKFWFVFGPGSVFFR